VSERKRPLPYNLLLAALPAVDRRRLLTNCEPVDLIEADTLVGVGDVVRHAFFPIDGFVSLIAVVDGSSQLEVGLAGNEGMVGTSLILGVRVAPLRALVRVAESGRTDRRVHTLPFSGTAARALVADDA
jgi:hypothetical protein